jgi:hypothetical protein
MGYSSKEANDVLLPEEALYLTENVMLLHLQTFSITIHLKIKFLSDYLNKSNLMVYHRDDLSIPLSIQQCYEKFFSEMLTIKTYKVFSNLTSCGYILRKPLVLKETPVAQTKSSFDVLKEDPAAETESSLDVTIKDSEKFSFPLVKKDENLTNEEIYKRLNDFIPSMSINQFKEKIASNEINPRIETRYNFQKKYDVYSPNKKFKKSHPTQSLFSIYEDTSNSEELAVPGLGDFVKTDQKSGNIVFSFVSGSDIMYYMINPNFYLPSIFELQKLKK